VDSSIAYYISSHGYGHGVRSCNIIRAINENYPRLNLHVISELPASFLLNQIRSTRNPIRARSFDVGMVQLDSIRVDVNATLKKIEQLCFLREELLDQELTFLAEKTIGLVVADIPGLPLEAAALAGIPSIAVGNFGWDWIYSDFMQRDMRWKSIVEMFRAQYGKTDLLLRLPFSEQMSAFRKIEDIPLVATPGLDRRRELAALTGCDPEKKWILLSFTTLDWTEDALARVERIHEYEFLTVLPLQWQRRNIYAVNREQMPFSDVLASADAVISKPGFGILSDCIVNDKPLVYADRTDFLEYPILEEAIRRYLRYVHIPAAKLYGGDLRESLDIIWERPAPEMKLQRGGDRIAADRIAGMLRLV
jgi:hypothetical protein